MTGSVESTNEDSGIDIDEPSIGRAIKSPTGQDISLGRDGQIESQTSSADVIEGPIEEVKSENDTPWKDGNIEPMRNGRPDVEIITAEAMTLAHQLATGVKSRAELIDDNFNKYSFRDTAGLPEWFLDDENKHSRIQRPITAAAAAAIKEKLRALNARPIKKIAEAKARKKMKAALRLEKMKKKSALLLEDDGISEADKAKSVAKMLAKASKKQPKRKVSVVVAKGSNRGISGRPKGTKGRYKMVDARLKKDIRAEKRLKKRLRK